MGDALERKGLAYAEAADKIESGDRVTEAADPQQRVQELRAKANACWREALDWYRQTIAKQADNSDAHGGLTRVHTLLGERREALAAADRALEIVTADYAFWEQRVRAPDVRIEEEKRMRSLLGRLQKILIATHMTAYQLCVELDQKAAALGHLDAALALDPERADAYSRRAQLRLEAADYAGAAKDIDAFLARSALAFEHPDMKKAWQIRREAEAGLKRQPASKP
jgi:tetratricopeptide (TPR) repeat protein